MLLEREVDKLLVRQAKLRGIVCVKVSSISSRGLPDRLLLGPGRLSGFIEVKRGRSRLTGLQHMMHATLNDAGVWCRILWGGLDREQTLPVIEQLLNDYQHRRES